VDAKTGQLGVPAVQPGDALFVRTDVRFSHEYVTPMAEALFVTALGKDAKVLEKESVFAFRDHLTFLGNAMSEKHREMGLLEQAEGRSRPRRRPSRRSTRSSSTARSPVRTVRSAAARPSATTR
jgi:3-isopropylmalate/(R)-2-methylmalate dehydratase large subunit